MDHKVKNYLVKVPVYVTDIIEDAEGLFGGVTLVEMEQFIQKKAYSFIEHKPNIYFENNNKSKRTVIENIKIKKQEYNAEPGFLVKISAYTTNLLDGYFEGSEKINFEKENKIGTDNNYIFIYPYIKGLEKSRYQHYFIILIYEDPNKLNDDIVKITKQTLQKIFGIPIRNIKMPTLLEELRSSKRAQELQVKYTAIFFDDNDVDVKYQEFLTSGKLKKQKLETYRNIPTALVEEMIMSDDFGDFDKMETKIIQGKKEYRLTKDHLKEAKDFMEQTAEKVFNATSPISENDLDKNIYDENFIISKILPVLENYLSSSDES